MQKRGARIKANKTVVNGISFQSETESIRYLQLLERISKREISDLELQPSYELQPHFRHPAQKAMVRAIVYKADFRYKENGKFVVEDTKGMRTEVFNLKLKLLLFKYPEIDFRLVTVNRPSKKKVKVS